MIASLLGTGSVSVVARVLHALLRLSPPVVTVDTAMQAFCSVIDASLDELSPRDSSKLGTVFGGFLHGAVLVSGHDECQSLCELLVSLRKRYLKPVFIEALNGA